MSMDSCECCGYMCVTLKPWTACADCGRRFCTGCRRKAAGDFVCPFCAAPLPIRLAYLRGAVAPRCESDWRPHLLQHEE